jgi:predicted transposase YbfD/YdcC
LLVVAVSAVLSGADTFVEIEAWAKEKLEWLREYLKLEQGIPSHDTFGRVFAAIDPDEFGAAFVRWVGQVLPVLANGDVVAIDGKTSRRSGKVGATPLHLVSAFAAQAGVVLGQRATAEKSNEKTAIPELLATLALEGSIVTIDAMGTQPNIAQAIRDRGADYLLAVKDNQPRLAESIDDFFSAFEAAPAKTPHQFHEVIEKDHGRIEVRRCYVFNQLDCLHAPERWPDLKSFAVITSERTIRGKPLVERRFYVSSLPRRAAHESGVRRHWRVENSLHWCMDVVFRRRPDARSHRSCRSEFRRLAPVRLESPAPCPGKTKGRPQGSATDRRLFGRLPRRTPGSCIRFMRLPWQFQPCPMWYEPERGACFHPGMSLRERNCGRREVWVDHRKDGDPHERSTADDDRADRAVSQRQQLD